MDGETRDEERQVVGTPVVAHESIHRSELRDDQAQEGTLVGVVREEQLPHTELLALERPDRDEERDRPGPGRQAGGLGIEVRGRRQRAEDGDRRRVERDAPLDEHDAAHVGHVESRAQPAGEARNTVVGCGGRGERPGRPFPPHGGNAIGEAPRSEHRLSSARRGAR